MQDLICLEFGAMEPVLSFFAIWLFVVGYLVACFCINSQWFLDPVYRNRNLFNLNLFFRRGDGSWRVPLVIYVFVILLLYVWFGAHIVIDMAGYCGEPGSKFH